MEPEWHMVTRRVFTKEFKVEAVGIVKE